LFHCIYL